MLNKMSPKNFESITGSIVDILSKNSNNKKFFEFTIESIFMKAVTRVFTVNIIQNSLKYFLIEILTLKIL